METHIDTSTKLVTLLRQGHLETKAEQLGELDRHAPPHLRLLILHVQKFSRECMQDEREASEDAERRQVEQEKENEEEKEKERARIAERARQRQEIEDSNRAQQAKARHQLLKARADREFRLAWLDSHQLVTFRRANQLANAG